MELSVSGGELITLGYHYTVVAWSISTEIFFYIVYPLVARLLRYVPAAPAALPLIVGCASVLTLANVLPFEVGHPKFPFQDWLTYLSPYTRVLEFIAGCALANAYGRFLFGLHSRVS